MTDPCIQSLQSLLVPSLCADETTYNQFIERMGQGLSTRDENPISHFSVYFLPYNPTTKEVFIVHHKKSGLWISPGGHIDKGERPDQTLVREIKEELGMEALFDESVQPFFFSIVEIPVAQGLPCKKHFDIWYLLQTDGAQFQIDPTEFHATRWMTIDGAKQIITDLSNLRALERVEAAFFSPS